MEIRQGVVIGSRLLQEEYPSNKRSILVQTEEGHLAAIINEQDLPEMIAKGILIEIDPAGNFHQVFVKVRRDTE